MNKKIFFIILILVIIVLAIFLLLHKNVSILPAPVAFVEENEIEILSTEETYSVPIKPYAKDENKNIVDIDGITFEDTTATFNFYDYTVSEEDENGYVTHSFKYDVTVPYRYSIDTSKAYPKWIRSFGLPQTILFDYYTGSVYKEQNVSLGGAKFSNIDDIGEEGYMKYIDISWDGKTYTIGVRTELQSKWDENKEVERADGFATYEDTYNATTKVFISVPKDYDGLMASIYKSGTTRASAENQSNVYNNYLNLQKESEESTEKSDELKEAEEMKEKVYNLFEFRYDPNITFTKDDFYVFRIKDIKAIENSET